MSPVTAKNGNVLVLTGILLLFGVALFVGGFVLGSYMTMQSVERNLAAHGIALPQDTPASTTVPANEAAPALPAGDSGVAPSSGPASAPASAPAQMQGGGGDDSQANVARFAVVESAPRQAAPPQEEAAAVQREAAAQGREPQTGARRKASPHHIKVPPGDEASVQFVWLVRAGAYLTRRNAEVEAKKLARLGYQADTVYMFDEAGRKWHVVVVGAFDEEEQANAFNSAFLEHAHRASVVQSFRRSLFEERVKHFGGGVPAEDMDATVAAK
ncbi:hypothetical protein JCM16814_30610 [Desulfobaculum senezii]